MRISDWSSDVCSSDLCLDDRAGAVDPAISALQCISQLGVCKAATKEINCVHFVSPLILHSLSIRARCMAMVRRAWAAMVINMDSHPHETRKCRVPSRLQTARPIHALPCERRTLPRWALGGDRGKRSEEHTSELQSLMRISYAVFCLKKKKATSIQTLKTQEHNQLRSKK